MRAPFTSLVDVAPPRATVSWLAPPAIGPGIRSYTQFCCLRSGRRHLTHSPRDRELMLVVDTLPEVLDARLRPATVTFWHRGRQLQAAPLLWARRAPFEEFWFDQSIELGQDARRSLTDQLSMLRLGARWVDLVRLLDPDRLELARMVMRHAWRPVDPVQREQARRVLATGPVLLQDVLQGHVSALSAPTALRLVFEGAAQLRPCDRLRPDTRIELPNPPGKENCNGSI